MAGNTAMNIVFDSTFDMSAAGSYSFDAYTVLSGDGNTANNAMATTHVTVLASPVVSISPEGPLSVCNGNTVTLTANSSSSYLWSTGATTQSIVVTTSGNYTVTITGANGCTASSAPVTVTTVSQSGGTVFTETMGSRTGTTAISLHESNNGFDNDLLMMSGSADGWKYTKPARIICRSFRWR